MRRPQNIFLTWVQKKPRFRSKTTPNLSQNKKSELKETWKIKVVQQYEQTPKQFLNLTLTAKNSQFGPQKFKTTPKLIKNQMSELKETQKIKVVQLHEYTQEQFSNPSLTSTQF